MVKRDVPRALKGAGLFTVWCPTSLRHICNDRSLNTTLFVDVAASRTKHVIVWRPLFLTHCRGTAGQMRRVRRILPQFLKRFESQVIVVWLSRPTATFGFTTVIYFFLPFLFRQLPSELTERNSTKLCHMFQSEQDMKMCVQNLGCPLSLNLGAQTTYFRRFSTTSQSRLNGNFNGGKYLPNETWFTQSGKGFGNYRGPTHSLKTILTLAHKQQNRTFIFTHHP